MPDALTTITKLIQSPPGQLAAGGVWQVIAIQFGVGLGLFYGVVKFFDLVGDRQSDNTKLEIAVWLIGRKNFGPKVQPWPDTFARIFDRVFGTTPTSWGYFLRSAYINLCLYFISELIFLLYISSAVPPKAGEPSYWSDALNWSSLMQSAAVGFFVAVIPGYISQRKTRQFLKAVVNSKGTIKTAIYLVLDAVATAMIFSLPLAVITVGYMRLWIIVARTDPSCCNIPPEIQEFYGRGIHGHFALDYIRIVEDGFRTPFILLFLPALFAPVLLWLYAGSGFILKAARHFDLGFEWFNRKFDIEKKPLQSIGLVAGVLVALVYWAAVLVSRVVG